MDYEIVMPQLSDSMDEGKLISWKVKVNDTVHIGDVIAEIESDKAVMEVQVFKNGVVLALNIKEGETAPVGTAIAKVQVEGKAEVEEASHKRVDTLPLKEEPKRKKEKRSNAPEYSLAHGSASPKAKILAKAYGLDIKKLQDKRRLPVPSHENDIKGYYQRRYFTPKALGLIEKYALEGAVFEGSKKHSSKDVLSYVQAHNTPYLKPLDSFQKALVKTVENSLAKPTYHIYEHIEAVLLEENTRYSITVWLIKIFGRAMMEFEGFRSVITTQGMQVYSNASISVAMAKDTFLYMPVFKDVNTLSMEDIEKKLTEYQEKIKEGGLTLSEMQGSTFGISNLGMTGIEGFDAIINQDDSAISAIGTSIEGKISVTLTIDHRLVNGYEAALFMQRVKSLCLDSEFFRGV